MMNKMSDENYDDLYDGMGDSSKDEQLTTTDEVDFKLEEKLSNVKLENQVLHQQALAMSPTGKSLSSWVKTIINQRAPENYNVLHGEAKMISDMTLAVSNPRELESRKSHKKVLNLKQQVANGMHGAYWILKDSGSIFILSPSFEVERTSIFDRIVQKLLQPFAAKHTLMPTGYRNSSMTTGRISQPVETKYPTLLFKQHLIAFLEKICGIIRDNLKKEISSLFGLHIQDCLMAPRTSQASLVKTGVSKLMLLLNKLAKSLNNNMKIMRANYTAELFVAVQDKKMFSGVNQYGNVLEGFTRLWRGTNASLAWLCQL
ncbi:myosin-17-like [Actinidia eriantha]|uniref:myosin-17-like n=1 Tax=Actinidia eriantha TaxID=165200 RepID=UPI00258BCA4A|nr:myosin-17-like [Actinidia eriantha]